MERQLWEILVPYQTNGVENVKKIDIAHHREWDAKVRAISGGLTILRPHRGQWMFEDKLFDEKMIPCRVLATREEIETIIAITLEHYPDQHAILAYRISSEIILKYRNE